MWLVVRALPLDRSGVPFRSHQCRAWIRKALNQNCLHYCFETLFSKSTLKLRSKYYDSHAIVRDDGAATAMCGVLKAFDTFPCDFGVDDPQLDVIRGLDPEDALVYSKKCKSELEVRGCGGWVRRMSCSSCACGSIGVAGA
jgi:hypothetical protein